MQDEWIMIKKRWWIELAGEGLVLGKEDCLTNDSDVVTVIVGYLLMKFYIT